MAGRYSQCKTSHGQAFQECLLGLPRCNLVLKVLDNHTVIDSERISGRETSQSRTHIDKIVDLPLFDTGINLNRPPSRAGTPQGFSPNQQGPHPTNAAQQVGYGQYTNMPPPNRPDFRPQSQGAPLGQYGGVTNQGAPPGQYGGAAPDGTPGQPRPITQQPAPSLANAPMQRPAVPPMLQPGMQGPTGPNSPLMAAGRLPANYIPPITGTPPPPGPGPAPPGTRAGRRAYPTGDPYVNTGPGIDPFTAQVPSPFGERPATPQAAVPSPMGGQPAQIAPQGQVPTFGAQQQQQQGQWGNAYTSASGQYGSQNDISQVASNFGQMNLGGQVNGLQITGDDMSGRLQRNNLVGTGSNSGESDAGSSRRTRAGGC